MRKIERCCCGENVTPSDCWPCNNLYPDPVYWLISPVEGEDAFDVKGQGETFSVNDILLDRNDTRPEPVRFSGSVYWPDYSELNGVKCARFYPEEEYPGIIRYFVQDFKCRADWSAGRLIHNRWHLAYGYKDSCADLNDFTIPCSYQPPRLVSYPWVNWDGDDIVQLVNQSWSDPNDALCSQPAEDPSHYVACRNGVKEPVRYWVCGGGIGLINSSLQLFPGRPDSVYVRWECGIRVIGNKYYWYATPTFGYAGNFFGTEFVDHDCLSSTPRTRQLFYAVPSTFWAGSINTQFRGYGGAVSTQVNPAIPNWEIGADVFSETSGETYWQFHPFRLRYWKELDCNTDFNGPIEVSINNDPWNESDRFYSIIDGSQSPTGSILPNTFPNKITIQPFFEEKDDEEGPPAE